MKKNYAAVVSVFLTAASVSMAQNPVPYQDTYEGYGVGSNLVGTVWQGDTNAALAIVTNLIPTEPSVGYPVAAAAHTKVMAFSDGTLTNVFDGTTSNLTVVAFDTMIRPVFAERPESAQMGAVSNSQVSIYIDTNGYVNVYHGVLAAPFPGTPDSTQWTALTNATQISSGSWSRLTLVMNYDAAGPISMYKVSVNGTFINSPEGYVSPDVGAAKDGPWFISPKWNDVDLRLHSIILSGSGMLDDLVVATNDITFSVGAQYATNGTPVAWMQAQGLNTNGLNTWDDVALADEDGDGASTWTEWIAGTSPTNAASKLFIVSITMSNSVPILKWVGTTNAVYPYVIQWSSNLMSIGAWTSATNNLPKVEGTNTITLPAAPFAPAFMRVNVSTN